MFPFSNGNFLDAIIEKLGMFMITNLQMVNLTVVKWEKQKSDKSATLIILNPNLINQSIYLIFL